MTTHVPADTDRRHIALLVNPARSELAEGAAARLGDVEMLTPGQASCITSTVRDALDRGVDIVAAVGGDGTQRSVVAGLADTAVPLGIVPGGTVNLLAQVLGVDDLDVAIDAIGQGATTRLDVGMCNDQVFVANSSSGFDAEVIGIANEQGKRRLGRLSFVIATLRRLLRRRRRPVEVVVDDELLDVSSAGSVIVMNLPVRSSSAVEVAPDAKYDDGLLDVLVVSAPSGWRLGRVVFDILRGVTPSDDVVRRQGRDIEVRWSTDVPVQIDGDAVDPSDHLRYSVRYGALEVCVPPSA